MGTNTNQMRKLSFIFLLSGCVMLACNSGQKSKKAETTDHATAESHEGHSHGEKPKDCNEVHWSHHVGEEGPQNWPNLCDGFMACGGESQSPIDIVDEMAQPGEELSAIEFSYASSPVDIINNGHTVQFNLQGDNSISIGDKKYDLLQFHYHALSEHTINGAHSPIEVHFVHKHSDTDFAVVGMMFTEGDDNALLASYLEHFPKEKGTYTSEDVIELSSLLPADASYYHYSGSLTTPPCSEVVSWYVLKEPISASAEQIEAFSAILHENYRPVMPLNERAIYSYVAEN